MSTNGNDEDQSVESENGIIQSDVAENPEINKFWIDFGTETVKGNIQSLDERAKFMITTCASLITVNFALLLVFHVQTISVKVTPQFFLAISSLFFALSYFPRSGEINLASPGSIEKMYGLWSKWKLKMHYIGFIFFIIGLFAAAVTSLI